MRELGSLPWLEGLVRWWRRGGERGTGRVGMQPCQRQILLARPASRRHLNLKNLRHAPPLFQQVDCTLLARLLWLSDVGAPPLANAALLARAAADGGGTAAPQQIPTPIPPPGWDAPRPHLRSLDLSACAWRPSACFRAPPLRRVIGLAPNLTECRAAGMVLAGVRKGGGEDAPAPAPVTLDAREAALLRAAAAAHPSLRVLTVDVAFPLPPTPTDLVAQAGQEQAAAAGAAPPRPPPPPGAAADLADAVAAAGGPGPLSLGRLSISSRPSAWWFPERPALAAAAAAVGAAAGGGGGPETLELVGLSGEEAAALACAALAPASTRVRALIITGCADGAAAWSPALAAAVGGCGSLARVTVDCRAWDEGDAAGLAGAVGVAAAAGRTLVATLNGVLIGPGALPPRAPTTPDRSPMQIG